MIDTVYICRYAIEENKLDKLEKVNSVHELTGVVKLFFRFENLRVSQRSGILVFWGHFRGLMK